MKGFFEFTLGKVQARRLIRLDTITRLIEYKGDYIKTGICVEGEAEPMWVDLSYDEVVAAMEGAETKVQRASRKRRKKEDL